MASKKKVPAMNSEDLGMQMQDVLKLMSSRTKGQASNEDVEKAVSKVLLSAGLKPSSPSDMKMKVAQRVENRKVVLDTENYDDDDVDKSSNEQKETSKSSERAEVVDIINPHAETIKTPVKRKRGRPRKSDQINSQQHAKKSKYAYDDIPLGKQGASMMTSFGDGPDPLPEAVAAALLGARSLLQTAIQDARAYRRKAKQQFAKARADVSKDYKTTKMRKQEAASKVSLLLEEESTQQQEKLDLKKKVEKPKELPGPQMLYRALSGHDKLAYDPRCGFDYEQLKALFPEEMRAYGRWNQMRAEYASKSDDKGDGFEKGDAVDEQENLRFDENSDCGGHISQRAAQFDMRTEIMEEGWYMEFSEHRKGSFLPRKMNEGDSEWERNRKAGNRGSAIAEIGVWSQMPAKFARFLHWVGFDPSKGLPPPNEETTQALGFLGYDFMGRIVEKAIFLRNLAKAKKNHEHADERTIMLELTKGEQLTASDIEKATNDTDIKPVALYTANDDSEGVSKPAAQLYFGPGFEERLEMELEELLCSGGKRKKISKEEAKIREQEDRLFAEIAAPPTTNNAVLHLLGQEDNDD